MASTLSYFQVTISSWKGNLGMMGALIVSGGSRGIGAATAICAARQGWDIAINYARDENAAISVADQVRSLGRRAIIVKGDMCIEEDFERLFNDT